jgi:DNA-binding SARP family transcriptional activator
MAKLCVFLFGHFRIVLDGQQLPSFPTHKSETLFAMLALQAGLKITRERLIGLLWPESDESRARHSLNTELWRLRRFLEARGVETERYLESERDGIGFQPNACLWVDVRAFEACLAPLESVEPGRLTLAQVKSLRRGTGLYSGDLLEGNYDEWCLMQREFLRARYLFAVELLMHWCLEHGLWREAILCGRRLLADDPLLEHIHRALMRCHAAVGARGAMRRQYQEYAARLHEELGTEPLEETRRLYRALCAGATFPTREPPAMPEAAEAPIRATNRALTDASTRRERARSAQRIPSE